MNVDYGAIGQRIKQVRRSRDMTQERLAEALSVSVGYISQIERGVTKINLDTLAAVAAHLNCELSELVTGVSVLQGRYLEGELAQLVDQMDGRQRKMLLEVAKLILVFVSVVLVLGLTTQLTRCQESVQPWSAI